MPQYEPLGVAVIGLGVGEQHARTFKGIAGVELTHLIDHDLPRATALATELDAKAAGTSFEAAVEDPHSHVVSIASFDHDHAHQVEAALRAGKHVFVEKPLCRTIEEARRIRHALDATEGELQLMSNLVLRGAPLYQWLHERVQAGAFGDVYAFDGDYIYGRITKITEGWRRDVPNYSVMEGGGIHLIDLMLWTLGQRPEEIACKATAMCTRDTPFEHPDHMSAQMTFPSGLIGRITANFGAVHQHQHVVRTFGTKRTFIHDDMGPREHRHYDTDPKRGPIPLTHAPLPRHKGVLIPSFVEAIRNRRDLSASIQTTIDSISIATACAQSFSQKRPVQVRYT